MQKVHQDADWYKAQLLVRGWLGANGIRSVLAGYYDPYDLITESGARLEVKYARYRSIKRGSMGWVFNIHRHGSSKEQSVDAYILRCEGVPELGFKYAFHLVVPAPIQSPTVCITVRSLITRYAKYFNSFEFIQKEALNGRKTKVR